MEILSSASGFIPNKCICLLDTRLKCNFISIYKLSVVCPIKKWREMIIMKLYIILGLSPTQLKHSCFAARMVRTEGSKVLIRHSNLP